jgi:hypothetical protein
MLYYRFVYTRTLVCCSLSASYIETSTIHEIQFSAEYVRVHVTKATSRFMIELTVSPLRQCGILEQILSAMMTSADLKRFSNNMIFYTGIHYSYLKFQWTFLFLLFILEIL